MHLFCLSLDSDLRTEWYLYIILFFLWLGHLSRELIPYVKSIVGVDISQRMVDEYNRRTINQGIDPEEMRAIEADVLVLSTSSELQKMKETFDVVVVSYAILLIVPILIRQVRRRLSPF
jgi:hypothetical protein